MRRWTIAARGSLVTSGLCTSSMPAWIGNKALLLAAAAVLPAQQIALTRGWAWQTWRGGRLKPRIEARRVDLWHNLGDCLRDRRAFFAGSEHPALSWQYANGGKAVAASALSEEVIRA
jgi:hypothetical protein